MANGQSNFLNRLLAALIVLVAIAIFVVGVLVVRSAFMGSDAPRTAIERDLVEAQAKLKQKPRDAQAHNELGSVYMRMGNYDAAAAEFKKAIKLNKMLLVAQYNLAMVYEAQKKTDLAVKELEGLVKKYPSDDNALFQLGRIHLGQGNYEKAVAALSQSVKFNPIDADSHFFLGLAYEKTGEKAKAIKEYRQVLRYIPDHKSARAALVRLAKK